MTVLTSLLVVAGASIYALLTQQMARTKGGQ